MGVGHTNGASAELVAVPAANASRLPDDLPRHWGALAEPLACAVHGLDRVEVAAAATYLIYGAGTMGLMLAQLARASGAGRIGMVDTNPARHTLAGRLAADWVASSADELERPRGWDVVIDATGAAIEDGLKRVARGGTFLMFGVAKDEAVVPVQRRDQDHRLDGCAAQLRAGAGLAGQWSYRLPGHDHPYPEGLWPSAASL